MPQRSTGRRAYAKVIEVDQRIADFPRTSTSIKNL